MMSVREPNPRPSGGDGKAEEIGLTFPEHLAHLQRSFPGSTGDFTALMRELMVAGKIISSRVRRSGLVVEMGRTGRINVQGEEVQFLDDFANQTIIRAMSHGGHVCTMSSEEEADVIPIPEGLPYGKYVLTFDPLDGSSNIEANASTGTIFSVHQRVTESGPGTLRDVLQSGRRQVAAGYILYGSSTMMVYAARGCGVFGFTLDPSVGEFLLSHSEIRIADSGEVYSVNEGNSASWDDADRDIVNAFKSADNPAGKPYTSRYIGSLVADFHRNLLYGGIFLYPHSRQRPNGKLRLLSEAAPLSFLCEAAGGKSTTGRRPILDVEPTELHQRVPLYIGSRREVEFIEKRLGRSPGSD
jgi:fructose-1,6-bisphosphatase I